MQQVITINISPDELQTMIVKAVEMVMIKQKDHTITRKEAASLLKCSPQTISRKEKEGTLRRLNVAGHPVYSYQEVLSVKMNAYNPL